MNTVKLGKDGLYIKANPPGLNNVTLCGTVRVSGDKGIVRIASYGAGNLVTPGYRLSAKANDGKFCLELLMVGIPGADTLPDGKNARYCLISSRDKTFHCGEWINFTVVMNRAEKAEIFVNGELVSSGPIQLVEKDDMSIDGRTVISAIEGDGDISMELANLEGYYSLLSSVDRDAITNKWFDMLRK
jgi:hypothetical protein